MGKRRLEAALEIFSERFPEEARPAVRWLPFQLNPDLPAEGIPRQAYIEMKFGPGAKRTYDRVAGIGKSVGIEFDFDAIKVQPNTINAHRLLAFGARNGREDETAEHLFKAYFLEGAVITGLSVLTDIGARAGLDRAALAAYLASDEDKAEIAEADLNARRGGISGVPFFIFNRRVAVSGAHEPDTLLQAMLQAVEP